jgi:hypothetical protein
MLALVAFPIMASALLLTALPALAGSGTFPPLIALPADFQPEGIATGRGSSFYVGNLYSGALYRGDYRTGTVQALAPSPGPGGQGLAKGRSAHELSLRGSQHLRSVSTMRRPARSWNISFIRPVQSGPANDVV